MAQRALGIPAAVTRRATAFQFAFAVGLGSVLVVPATAASGIAFLAFWGAGNARDLSLWMPATILACGGVALTRRDRVAAWPRQPPSQPARRLIRSYVGRGLSHFDHGLTYRRSVRVSRVGCRAVLAANVFLILGLE